MVNVMHSTGDIDPSCRLAIVVSRFNESMTANLLHGATNTILEHGISEDNLDVVWVPGAWEIPLALQLLARRETYAALIALGVVIRGETTHDRQISRFVSLSIGELSLKFDVPIGMGLLTCKTVKQALRRCDPNGRNKGGQAALAALDMMRLIGSLKS